MMKRKMAFLWVCLLATSSLSWVVYLGFSSNHSYTALLTILAVADLLVALAIIVLSRFAWRTVLLALLVLAVGQSWLVVWLGVFMIWSTRGFAP